MNKILAQWPICVAGKTCKYQCAHPLCNNAPPRKSSTAAPACAPIFLKKTFWYRYVDKCIGTSRKNRCLIVIFQKLFFFEMIIFVFPGVFTIPALLFRVNSQAVMSVVLAIFMAWFLVVAVLWRRIVSDNFLQPFERWKNDRTWIERILAYCLWHW